MRVDPQQLKAFLIDANLATEKQFDESQKKATKSKLNVGDIFNAG